MRIAQVLECGVVSALAMPLAHHLFQRAVSATATMKRITQGSMPFGIALLTALAAGCGDASVSDLQQGEVGVRRQAARSLAEADTAPAGAESIPALSQALRDPDPEVRRLSAYALSRSGSQAAAALPPLESLLQDPDESVRLAAAYAITAIAPGDPAPVGVLTKAAEGGDARAIIALGRIGPPAADAVPALITGLHSQSSLVRIKAAEALGRIGDSATDAVPTLRRATKDVDEDVRSAAEASLALIEAGGE